ncbi:hypothetical protein CRYUN_Cryun01aG0017800 [Craigia yunnanensis]
MVSATSTYGSSLLAFSSLSSITCSDTCIFSLVDLWSRSESDNLAESIGAGSDLFQGAGAPTMFQAMRCIVGSLANSYAGESAFDRAIRQSFRGGHEAEQAHFHVQRSS